MPSQFPRRNRGFNRQCTGVGVISCLDTLLPVPLEMKPPADTSVRLRPGRHGIPPELVVENQRGRIIAATCASHRELGYAGMNSGDITARAGVSRATFYKLFDNKSHCVADAQLDVAATMREEIDRAASVARAWPDRVDAVVGATLDYASRSPERAFLLFSDPDPALARTPAAFQAFLADLLSPDDMHSGGSAPLPERTEQALVGGLRSVIVAQLLDGLEDELPTMREELVEIVLILFLGRPDASKVARQSAP